ncbi:MAG: phage portal protein, partial [Planctomycetes bacterium]|nr:phage portal protein [Planctomycetota bacterium]
MTIEAIQKLISANSTRVAKIEEQKKYAGGYNSAILGRKAHEEPDNRIPIPIARKGIRLVTGYMAKPGNIVYSDDAKYVEDILQPIFDLNDEQLTTQEELESALMHGDTWEYHYTKDSKFRFVEVPAGQCVPVYDDDLPPKLIGMIRYYKHKEEDDSETKEIYYFDDSTMTKYIGKGDADPILAPDIDGQANPMRHGYKQVPFNQLKISRDCSNLFDCVIPLIDIHDRTISEDWANELQRFANSYLLLANRLSKELDESGLSEIDKVRITRSFEDLGENVKMKVDFLTKEIPGEFVKSATELFEREIYDMMQIINPNEIAATGEISGIALAYKLLQFEYYVASIEAYFSRGLQKRIM